MKLTNSALAANAASRNLAAAADVGPVRGTNLRPAGAAQSRDKELLSATYNARNELMHGGTQADVRDALATALDGLQTQERGLQEQLEFEELMTRLQLDPGFRPAIKRAPSATAADVKSGKTSGDALPKGVNAAFVPSKGIVLVREGLSGKDLQAAVKEELGEWLGAQAEKRGVTLAPGDVGARVLKVLSGEILTRADFVPRESDRTEARLNGDLVGARPQQTQLGPKGKGPSLPVFKPSFHKAFSQPAGVNWGQLHKYGFKFAKTDGLSFQQKSLILQILNGHQPLTTQELNQMVKKGWLNVTKADGTVALNLKFVPNGLLADVYEQTSLMLDGKSPLSGSAIDTFAAPGYSTKQVQAVAHKTFNALGFWKAKRPVADSKTGKIIQIPVAPRDFFDLLEGNLIRFDDRNVVLDVRQPPKPPARNNSASRLGKQLAPTGGARKIVEKQDYGNTVVAATKPVATKAVISIGPIVEVFDPIKSVTITAKMLDGLLPSGRRDRRYAGHVTDGTLLQYKDAGTGKWVTLLQRGKNDKISGPLANGGSKTINVPGAAANPGQAFAEIRMINTSYGTGRGRDAAYQIAGGKTWNTVEHIQLTADKNGKITSTKKGQWIEFGFPPFQHRIGQPLTDFKEFTQDKLNLEWHDGGNVAPYDPFDFTTSWADSNSPDLSVDIKVNRVAPKISGPKPTIPAPEGLPGSPIAEQKESKAVIADIAVKNPYIGRQLTSSADGKVPERMRNLTESMKDLGNAVTEEIKTMAYNHTKQFFTPGTKNFKIANDWSNAVIKSSIGNGGDVKKAVQEIGKPIEIEGVGDNQAFESFKQISVGLVLEPQVTERLYTAYKKFKIAALLVGGNDAAAEAVRIATFKPNLSFRAFATTVDLKTRQTVANIQEPEWLFVIRAGGNGGVSALGNAAFGAAGLEVHFNFKGKNLTGFSVMGQVEAGLVGDVTGTINGLYDRWKGIERPPAPTKVSFRGKTVVKTEFLKLSWLSDAKGKIDARPDTISFVGLSATGGDFKTEALGGELDTEMMFVIGGVANFAISKRGYEEIGKKKRAVLAP